METVPMLGDVDDEQHFAQLLEVAYCEAATELNDLVRRFSSFDSPESSEPEEIIDVYFIHEDLARLQFIMIATVQQTIERRRRLANVTGGLADVVLDKEGSEE